ncbi:uncharacterized protein LOC111881461 [Lactuca sativa]|uniref:uncharacterized protein LOC111881461 n=1 Tax=Lactuca sativa TaxID=4236 RepID=UPI000CD84823|nr:uncharacterized protein LOC111881461 [Lactuca sativa]
MEFNLIFVMGLQKEWRSVSMMVKNQQSFDKSSLNDLYNQLKTHESELNEMEEESKMSLGGPLALVSKMSEKEIENDEPEEEEGFIMNSDDEAVAFYSNNRVKKFYKKPFNPKTKQAEVKNNPMSKVIRDEKKKVEKEDSKVLEGKVEKKLKGDAGVDFHYCNGANHLANDCMLRKKDERKNKIKNEAYYAEKLEEVREKTKNMSLVARGEQEEDGTYQIWSSGSDDEEMQNPTHRAMYAKLEEDSDDEKYELKGRCFISKTADKSPMTTKTVTYFDSIIVSASNEANKLSMELLETKKKLDAKTSKVDCLELQIKNIMCDRETLANEINILLVQRNIYCNSAKRQYGKLTDLHHSCEISKEQYRKLMPFLAYERAKVDNVLHDCEEIIANFDKVPDDRYKYGIVKIDECLDTNELVDILSVVNVVSTSKGKENLKDLKVEVETDKPSTSKVCDLDFVEIKDSQIDDSDDEKEEIVLKKKKSSKGAHFLETNTVVYPNFKCSDDVIFPNQVFVTTGNVENVKPKFKKLVKEDNLKTTYDGFFLNQSTVENNLTKNSYVFNRQKPQRKWVEKSQTVKEVLEPIVVETEKLVKLNSKEFKDQVDKFSKENNISKRQARKKIFWQTIESQKMTNKTTKHVKTCQVKGYGKITNGQFTVNRVANVDGLQHNLINVSQLVVGTDNHVLFNEEGSIILNVNTNEVFLKSKRKGEMFTLDINPIVGKPAICLLSKASSDISWLWHRRLSHLNFRNINKLVVQDLASNINKVKVHVLRLKSDVAQIMIDFINKMETTLKKTVRKIKSDHGTEFKNKVLDSFLVHKGISHNFSSPYTPSQNGVFGMKSSLLHVLLKIDLSSIVDLISLHTKLLIIENLM